MTTKQEVVEYLRASGWEQSLGLTADPCVSPAWEKFIDPLDVPGLPRSVRDEDPIIVVSLRAIGESSVGAWLKGLQLDLNRSHYWEPEHYAYPVAIAPILERFRDDLESFGKESL
jgi:hypothetical protein